MADQCFGEEELNNLRQVIESGELWRGLGHANFTARFEEAFGKWLGRKYVLGVCSGTCAEEVALAGLGLEPGDEVICPASAPIFVSFPVVSIGCIPVFADVDPETLIISPAGIEARITERTRAVMVVHLWGMPAPMGEIMAMARKHHLKVLEDCAQAYGPTWRGQKVGTIGDVACYSLQQSKHISSGEGGIFATDDAEMYQRAMLFANCGMPWYGYGLAPPTPEPVAGIPIRGHFAFGHNYRMSELQGAVCLAQLPKLPEFNRRRAALVKAIEEELAGAPASSWSRPIPARSLITGLIRSGFPRRSVITVRSTTSKPSIRRCSVSAAPRWESRCRTMSPMSRAPARTPKPPPSAYAASASITPGNPRTCARMPVPSETKFNKR